MTARVCHTLGVLLVLWSGLWASRSAEGTIYHQAPSEVKAREPLTLEAIVEVEATSVASVLIYYRTRGQTAYFEAPMSPAGGNLYFGTIPAGDVVPEGLEYYLIAVTEDNSIIGYPADEPEQNPFFVRVLAATESGQVAAGFVASSELEAGDFLVLSPDPNAAYLPQDVVVAVSLFNLPDVALSSIKLLLNGEDITSQSEINSDLVTYNPADLATGNYQLQIQANSSSGAAYRTVSLPFRVTRIATQSSERAFRHSGTLTPGFNNKNIDGEVLEVSSFKVSYRGGWEWLRLRGKLKLTSEEDAFKSPRNRYFASFQTPLLTVGFGDVTPRFGRFGLAGKRLRGYDANITLGPVNLRVAQGELERVIQGSRDQAFSVDALESDTLRLSRTGYTFRRDVIAIRPSIGSGRVFELAFSFVKAKDDILSVTPLLDDGIVDFDSSLAADEAFRNVNWLDDTLYTIRYRDLAEQSTLPVHVLAKDWDGKGPQDNIVIGSNISLALNKRRFVLQSGFSLSMLNKNIWDPVLSLKELDTFAPGDTTENDSIGDFIALDDLPIDPADLEDFFHINLNQVPLLPIDPFLAQTDILRALANAPSVAYYASAKLNYLRNFITLEFQQVGPEYNSLANPNLQKNVRITTISDRVRLFRSKLFLSGTYRATDDDIVKLQDDPETLDKDEGEPITRTETVNLSASLNLGQGLPSVSFGTRSYGRNNGVEDISYTFDTDGNPLDTADTRVNTLTSSTNFGLGYRLQMLSSTHNLRLTVSKTVIGDEIEDRLIEYVSPAAESNILGISVNTRFSDRLETNAVFSTNNLVTGDEENRVEQDILSLDLSAQLRLMNGRLSVQGGVAFTDSKTNQEENPIAPPAFTRLGLKGQLRITLVNNLNFVTSFDIRQKSFDDPDLETSPTSIFAANLEYIF